MLSEQENGSNPRARIESPVAVQAAPCTIAGSLASVINALRTWGGSQPTGASLLSDSSWTQNSFQVRFGQGPSSCPPTSPALQRKRPGQHQRPGQASPVLQGDTRKGTKSRLPRKSTQRNNNAGSLHPKQVMEGHSR